MIYSCKVHTTQIFSSFNLSRAIENYFSGFDVLSNDEILKKNLSELRLMFLIFKFTRVCALAAVDKARSVHNFQVRSFMSNEFKGKENFNIYIV